MFLISFSSLFVIVELEDFLFVENIVEAGFTVGIPIELVEVGKFLAGCGPMLCRVILSMLTVCFPSVVASSEDMLDSTVVSFKLFVSLLSPLPNISLYLDVEFITVSL